MNLDKQCARHQRITNKLSKDALSDINTRIYKLSNDFIGMDKHTLSTRTKQYAMKSLNAFRKKDVIENLIQASAYNLALTMIYSK